MDTNQVVITAAVSAFISVGTTLVVHKIQQAKATKEQSEEMQKVGDKAYTKGWYEGRESILQQAAVLPVGTKDFENR